MFERYYYSNLMHYLHRVISLFSFPKLAANEKSYQKALVEMDRLDQKHSKFRSLVPMPLKPSDYIRRNCYFVAEPEERTIGAMLELVGEDRILWGSDYPHVDSTLEAPQLIRRSIASLSATRQAAVLGENARRVFCL